MKEQPGFIEDWVSESWNHEWGDLDDDNPKINEIFMNKVQSASIQKYLQKDLKNQICF